MLIVQAEFDELTGSRIATAAKVSTVKQEVPPAPPVSRPVNRVASSSTENLLVPSFPTFLELTI